MRLTGVNFASAVHDVSPTLNWGVRGEQSEGGKRFADAICLCVICVCPSTCEIFSVNNLTKFRFDLAQPGAHAWKLLLSMLVCAQDVVCDNACRL